MALLVVDFLKAPIGIDLIPDKKISCAGPGIVDRRSSGIIPLVIDWPVVMSKTSQFALKQLPAFAISKTTFADRAKSKGPPTSGTDARFALASWLPLAATFAYHSRAFAKSCGPPMLPARGSKAQETLSQVVDLSHSSRPVSL